MKHGLFDAEFVRKLELLRVNFRRQQARHIEGRLTALQRGGRIEFADHRTYSPGDDLRYLDWRLYARTGKFFIKEFRKDQQPLVVVLVDASRSMDWGQPSKWDFARRVAAAIAFVALSDGHAVDAACFSSEGTRWCGIMVKRSAFFSLLDFLANAPAAGGTCLAGAVGELTVHHPRACLVVLISDLLDPQGGQSAVGALAAKGYDVTVLHVLSPQEWRVPWRGPMVLCDLESGRRRWLVLDDQICQQYVDEVKRLRESWRSFCASHQALFLTTSTGTPFEEFIMQYLRSGGLLK